MDTEIDSFREKVLDEAYATKKQLMNLRHAIRRAPGSLGYSMEFLTGMVDSMVMTLDGLKEEARIRLCERDRL
jgi:hypothetical protein